ncbi:MAG: hypothetical protein WD423_07875 [Rhodothermales bacterium]
MNEDLTRDYLEKSEFSPMQADALAKLLSETATKDDLAGLETRLDAKIDRGIADLRSELGQAIAETRSDLSKAIAETRADLSQDIAETRADLSRVIADTRADLTGSIADNRTHLEGAINRVETRIMKWGIAMIVAMALIFTLLDIFID